MHLGHVVKAGAALARQLLVHMHDEVVVLGMNRGEAAGFGQCPQHLHDAAERHHAALAARGDVGGEHLHGRMTGGNRLGELVGDGVLEIALHHCVEGIVAIAVAGPFLLPPFDRLLHRVVAVDEREIEDHRRAAEQRGLADPVGAIGHVRLGLAWHRHRPATMDMRVDAAGNDDLAGRVDDPAAERRQGARRADRDDLLALGSDIGLFRAGGQDGGAAGDDDVEHGRSPLVLSAAEPARRSGPARRRRNARGSPRAGCHAR